MLRSLSLGAIASMFFVWASVAKADDPHHKFSFYQQKFNGRAVICGVEHSFIFDDGLNRDGAVAHVAIEFSGGKNQVFARFIIQEGLFTDGLNNLSHIQPTAGAAISFGDQYYQLSRTECKFDKLSFCGEIAGDQAAGLVVALSTQSVKLILNRKLGGLDYQLDLSERPSSFMPVNELMLEERKHAGCLLDVFDLE